MKKNWDYEMWPITLVSILGVILNIKKRKECFLIWAGTNFAWMVYDYRIGAHAQAALFFVYFVLAIWGLWEWSAGKGRGNVQS